MKIGEIIRKQQPKEFKKLMAIKTGCNLDFEDFERMMRHDSYKRDKGAIKQTRNT